MPTEKKVLNKWTQEYNNLKAVDSYPGIRFNTARIKTMNSIEKNVYDTEIKPLETALNKTTDKYQEFEKMRVAITSSYKPEKDDKGEDIPFPLEVVMEINQKIIDLENSDEYKEEIKLRNEQIKEYNEIMNTKEVEIEISKCSEKDLPKEFEKYYGKDKKIGLDMQRSSLIWI